MALRDWGRAELGRGGQGAVIGSSGARPIQEGPSPRRGDKRAPWPEQALGAGRGRGRKSSPSRLPFEGKSSGKQCTQGAWRAGISPDIPRLAASACPCLRARSAMPAHAHARAHAHAWPWWDSACSQAACQGPHPSSRTWAEGHGAGCAGTDLLAWGRGVKNEPSALAGHGHKRPLQALPASEAPRAGRCPGVGCTRCRSPRALLTPPRTSGCWGDQGTLQRVSVPGAGHSRDPMPALTNSKSVAPRHTNRLPPLPRPAPGTWDPTPRKG